MIIGNVDKQLLLTLNSFVGINDLYNGIIIGIGNNPLFRGFPIFFAVVALWFSDDCSQRRGRMLVGLLAACVATLLSYWLQYHVTLHIRPLLDPALDVKVADPHWIENWRRQSSFPSDTATLF